MNNFNINEGIVVSGNDIIKYATEQFVRYLDTKTNKPKQKKGRKTPKERLAFYNRWFGVLPFFVKTSFKSCKKSGRDNMN